MRVSGEDTFFFFSATPIEASGPAAAKVNPTLVVLRKSRLELSQEFKTSIREVFFMGRMVTEHEALASFFVI